MPTFLPTLAMACIAVPAGAVLLSSAILGFDSRRLRHQAQHGVENITLVTTCGQLIHQLQRERGMSVGFLSASTAASPLLQQRQETDRVLAAFHQTCRMADSGPILQATLDSLSGLPTLRQQIDQRMPPLADAVRAYSGRIGALLDLVGLTVHSSVRGKLARLGTAYVNLLSAKEAAGQERALLTGALARQEMDLATRRKARELIEQQHLYLKLFQDRVGAPLAGQCASQWQDSQQAIEQMRLHILDQEDVSALPSSAQWFSTATDRIDALHRCENLVETHLAQAAQGTMTSARQHKRQFASMVTASAAIAASLVFVGLGN